MKLARTIAHRFSTKNIKVESHINFLGSLKSPAAIAHEKFIYYKLLNVDKNASTEEIKANYKEFIRIIHPDVKNAHSTQISPEVFDLFQTAYKTLSDERKRMQYNQEQEKTFYFVVAVAVIGVGLFCNFWYFPRMRRGVRDADSIESIWHQNFHK